MTTSRSFVFLPALRLLGWLLAPALFIHAAEAAEPQWKTIFYKRTFMGALEVKPKGSAVGTTVRMPVYIPVKAEKIRVWVRSDFDVPIEFSRMAFVRASGNGGAVEATPVPLLFDGKPGVMLARRDPHSCMAEAAAAFSPGLWYLETYYTSAKCSYAYDGEGGFTAPDDSLANAGIRFRPSNVYVGNAYRIEALTDDPAPVIVCYGDSITQGAGSTRMSGNNYPHLLGRLLNRPAVNLGVHSDLLIHAGMAADLSGRMKGASDLIFLMGINDIAWGGQIKNAADYASRVGAIVADAKKRGLKTYIGTIMPAGGLKIFDKNPAKEALRQEINAWIRKQTRADGVIDFDAALRDPKDPVRLRADYQCGDWIHPSDAGYQKMAETAAEVLKSASKS